MTAQDMKLKRVLGFTTNGRNSFVVQPNTGNIIYIAGCVVVILNPHLKSQKHLIPPNSKQTITTLAITEDGRYLAAADCGLQSVIHIWDLTSMTLTTEFVGHNVEVSCMCFSTNGVYLVSVGAQHDMTLNVWDWRRQVRLTSHKVSAKVRAISFAMDNSYFITVGDSYAKYWYINDTTAQDTISISLSCRSAILGEQKGKNFCDVKCGRGSLMGESTFCITKDGLLCELNKRRLLHKWVDLRTSGANCLAVSENIIVIGCANGVARCFNTSELRFLKNLPRPHTLGLDISSLAKGRTMKDSGATQQQQQQHHHYPNVIAIGLDEGLNSITCVHNDRSLYTWDLSDPSGRVVKRYSALYHSSCIWGIDTYPSTATNPLLPLGSFITCSSDDTLRIWHPNVFSTRLSSSIKNGKQDEEVDEENDDNVIVYSENQFSAELSKIVFTDSAHKFLCDLDDGNGKNNDTTAISGDEAGSKVDLNYDSTEGLRCLKISPSGTQLAVGNRSGAIRVFDFELDTEIKNIAAHDAEVLCLEYSDPRKFSGYCYLASSSRDKLIHIFDASNNNYTFLQTIDDHLSSITALRFVNNRARDCLQLVSCGADQRIIFRNGLKDNSTGQLNFVTDQHIEGKTTFYDMEVDSESSCLMTACQDRMIRLFNVAQVRYQSGFKGSIVGAGSGAGSDSATLIDSQGASGGGGGTLIKIALDPSCTFLAASCTDKSLSVYDYQRGECLASVWLGLSDLITDMKFSHDGRYLIACSGDGCIFIWKSPAEIANTINSQLNQHQQLSLSSCSLGSLNNGKHSLGQDKTQELHKLKSLPDWARQQMLDELDRNRYSGGSGGSSERLQSSANSSSNKQQLAHSRSRYQVHNNNSNNNQSTSMRTTLTADGSAASAADYLSPTKSSDLNMASDHYATLGKVANRESPTNSESKQHANLEQMSRLAKAKLFQSRENLERITSRERFLQEGLALNHHHHHHHHSGSGASSVGRSVHRQTNFTKLSDNNQAASGVGGGCVTNSSLSGLFNTKLNAAGYLDLSVTGHHHHPVQTTDEMRLVKERVSAPHPPSLPTRSTSNLYFQGQYSAANNNNNNSNSSSVVALSHSEPEEELSSEEDENEISGSSAANKLNRPITPPKPSLHRQIRRNSANSNTIAGKHLTKRNSSDQIDASAPSFGSSLSSSNTLIKAVSQQQQQQQQRQINHFNRKMANSNHLQRRANKSSMMMMRSSRSECNLDALDDAHDHDYQQQQQLLEKQVADESPIAKTTSTLALDDEVGSLEGSIYCQKLNLNKLNPAQVQLNCPELCHYVVEELQQLSKYATRLHQRLQSAGNRNLSSILARGVQNSMDILSIVPPLHQHNNGRFQSHLSSVSPEAAAAAAQTSKPPARKQQQPLKRPASSNSILATLPVSHNVQQKQPQQQYDRANYPMSHTTRIFDTKPSSLRTAKNNDSKMVDQQQQQQQARKSLESEVNDYHDRMLTNSSPSSEAVAVGDNKIVGGSGELPPALADSNQVTVNKLGKHSTNEDKQQTSGSSKNNQLNLDQVLEAYSDRLFRMVQERMAASSSSSSPDASHLISSTTSAAQSSKVENANDDNNFQKAIQQTTTLQR